MALIPYTTIIVSIYIFHDIGIYHIALLESIATLHLTMY
nr:MAG TPA: hypothetical protein [Bacteriophage sp.]